MKVETLKTKEELGKEASSVIVSAINDAISKNGEARVILATGASQFEVINELTEADVDWSKVTCFHLDEYVGMSIKHNASFRKYMQERFMDKVKDLKVFHFVNGDAENLDAELENLDKLIKEAPIDVAAVGIGENGHLAFNDPPADFEIENAYIVVDLDEDCRKQQLGEGWFDTLEDVPKQAISMSIKQIMKSEKIVCSVPDERKAQAVKNCVKGKISNLFPASILQEHKECALFLDESSASLL